jgi:hypothetical protein
VNEAVKLWRNGRERSARKDDATSPERFPGGQAKKRVALAAWRYDSASRST